MDHAGEGTLQAYLDGEVEGAAAVALSDHVAGCAVCAEELESLRGADRRVAEALALLDEGVAVPMLSAQAGVARARNRGWRIPQYGVRGLAKAAGLLLIVTGAGVAAIPELRDAVESVVTRVVERVAGVPDVAETPVAAPEPVVVEPATGLSFISPAAGRVRVLVHAPSGRLDIVVRLADASRASVETSMEAGPVRLRSGSGRLELLEPGAGTVTITIPRGVPNASIEVDGRVWVHKDGDILSVSGPGVEERGSEVRFTIDP